MINRARTFDKRKKNEGNQVMVMGHEGPDPACIDTSSIDDLNVVGKKTAGIIRAKFICCVIHLSIYLEPMFLSVSA